MDATDVDAIRDEHDLAVALSIALRDARAAGDTAWERLLHATLSQTVHTLGLDIDERDAVPAATVMLNGRLDYERIRLLLRAS